LTACVRLDVGRKLPVNSSQARFWQHVSSVCLSVCDVLYCGETVRPIEKLSEGVTRKPGSKVDFLGRRHISTSGFVRSATASFSWVSCLITSARRKADL